VQPQVLRFLLPFAGHVLVAALVILALASLAMVVSAGLVRLTSLRQRGEAAPAYVMLALVLLALGGAAVGVPGLPGLRDVVKTPPPPPAPPAVGEHFHSPGNAPKPGDWCLLRIGERGDRDILFTLVSGTSDSTAVRMARTDGMVRTETLNVRADDRVPYELLDRLGLDVCPPLRDVTSAQTESTTATLGDEKLEITKISFTGARPDGTRGPVVLWLSERVRFPGIFAIDFSGRRVAQVVGFGVPGQPPCGRDIATYPFNPFERAEAGDWAEVLFKRRGWTWRESYVVEGVVGREVTLGRRRQGNNGSVSTLRSLTFSTASAPELSDLVDFDWEIPPISIAAVTSGETVLRLDGRDFPCTTLSCQAAEQDDPAKRLSVWFSTDVRSWGLAELRVDDLDARLVGYGTRTEALLGKKPDW
jgi:hypothetical protein